MRRWVYIFFVALGVFIIVVTVVSWYLYPTWRDDPSKFLGPLQSAAVGVISIVGGLVSLIKDIRDLSEKSSPKSTVTQTIQGDITQSGDQNIVATNINAEQIGGTRIEHADQVFIHSQRHAPRIPLLRPQRAEYFTGRQDELEKLLSDLQPGRVVTLCGPGGIGKTALAAEAIWSLAPMDDPPDRFPDGIIFHSFYDQPETATVLENIALIYGEEPRPTLRSAALRALAGRHALLILDGAENADNLSAVLDICDNCGVLITSRSRRDAPADREDITPLSLNESATLLQSWAGARAQDQADSESICQLLGGLPLAIRLAGRYMSAADENAAQYLRWLQDTPLLALDHGQRGKDSIPILLDRSFDQLVDIACHVLPIVGVLSLAPFHPLIVTSGLDLTATELKPALIQLVNYGILLHLDDRYVVSHPLIHSYASRRLQPDSTEVERIAAFYANYVDEQRQLGTDGFARLDLERAHIFNVLSACMRNHQWVSVTRLVRVLDDYLDLCGYWTERITALEIGLSSAIELDCRRDECTFLGNLGNTYSALGQVDRAIEYCLQALEISQEIGDRREEGNHLGDLGNAYSALGQVDRAIEYYVQALEIAQEISYQRGEGNHLGNLGNAYFMISQFERAIEYYLQALVIAQEIGDRRGVGVHLGNLGNAYSALSQMEQAIDYHQQSLGISREIGDRLGEGNRLGNLGLAYTAIGQTELAIDYQQQALVISQEIGDRRGEGNRLGNLGGAYNYLGQFDKAIGYHHQALVISQEIGDRIAEGNHLDNLGLAYNALGQVDTAIDYHQQALVISREISDRRGEGNRLGNLGNAYFCLGQVDTAIDYHQQALEISQDIGDRRGEGNHLGNLGNCYFALGQMEQAIDYHQQALEISQEIGDQRGEGNHLGNLGNAYSALGQMDRAIYYHQQALEISQKVSDRREEGNHLGNLGNCYFTLGQLEQAIDYHQQALEISQEIDDQSGEGNHLGNLGNCYFTLGRVERAIEYYTLALSVSQRINDRRRELNHLANLGLVSSTIGHLERAIDYYNQALEIAHDICHPKADEFAAIIVTLRSNLNN